MTYKDVTINQFQRLAKSIKENEENKYALSMDLLNIFENISYEESSKIKVKDIDKRVEKYNFLFTENIEDVKWVKEFEFKDKTYKVNQFIHEWTYSQFVSVNTIINTDPIQHLHILVAIMCEDERHYLTRAEEFKDLPILTAYPLMVFFCAVLTKLEADTPNFWERVENPIGFQVNGGGMTWQQIFTKSLELLRQYLKQKFS